MHRSDSGGFKSHKPDSVAALNPAASVTAAPPSVASHQDYKDEPIYYNKRQSMIKSQECIQDMPDLPSELPDPGLGKAMTISMTTVVEFHREAGEIQCIFTP